MIGGVIYILISLVLGLVIGYLWLNIARKFRIIEYCFLKDHQIKNGTLTGGGIIFFIPFLFVTITEYSISHNIRFLIIAFISVSYYIIGLIDDLIKVYMKQNKGLSIWQKLLMHSAWSIFVFYVMYVTIPFSLVHLILSVLLIILMINAVNISDGLDGLAVGNGIIVIVTISVLNFANGKTSLGILSLSLAAACIGFLVYNFNPAIMFMGDSGATLLGALIATLAFMGGVEHYMIIAASGIIFDGFSSLIQKSFKKLFKKEIFPMSPVHFTFTKLGMKEKHVVFLTYLFTFFMSSIALMIFFVTKLTK